MTTKTNLFLTKGANIGDMVSVLPKKESKKTTFIAKDGKIQFDGNPAAMKYWVPTMSAIIKMLPESEGFKEVRTPVTYIAKKNSKKHRIGDVVSTEQVTWTYTNQEKANILVENAVKVCIANYEAEKAKKENNK